MRSNVKRIIRGGRAIRKQLQSQGLNIPPVRKALAQQFRKERKAGIRIPHDYGVKPKPRANKPMPNFTKTKPFTKAPPKFVKPVDRFAKTKPFTKKPPRFKAPIIPKRKTINNGGLKAPASSVKSVPGLASRLFGMTRVGATYYNTKNRVLKGLGG